MLSPHRHYFWVVVFHGSLRFYKLIPWMIRSRLHASQFLEWWTAGNGKRLSECKLYIGLFLNVHHFHCQMLCVVTLIYIGAPVCRDWRRGWQRFVLKGIIGRFYFFSCIGGSLLWRMGTTSHRCKKTQGLANLSLTLGSSIQKVSCNTLNFGSLSYFWQ